MLSKLFKNFYTPKLYSKEYLELKKLPKVIFYLIIISCLLPSLVNIIGIDFSTIFVNISLEQLINLVDHNSLKYKNAIFYILIEWSVIGVITITITMLLCFYVIMKDKLTLIVLFALTIIFAFKIVYLQPSIATALGESNDKLFIVLNSGIANLLNTILFLSGVFILLYFHAKKDDSDAKLNIKHVLVLQVLLLGLALFIFVYLKLDENMFSVTSLNWEIISNFFYYASFMLSLVSLYLFKAYYHRNPSIFLHSLVLSFIPQLMTEIHNIIGSDIALDNSFFVAKYLNIIIYMIIILGMLFELISRSEENKRYAQKLELANKELDEFTYISSHDLKEPIRGIKSNVLFMLEDFGDQIPLGAKKRIAKVEGLACRMELLVSTLLGYSKMSKTELVRKFVITNNLLANVLLEIETNLADNNVKLKIKNLPEIYGDEVLLKQLFLNLITNAIKYNDKEAKYINIGSINKNKKTVFYVKDNGIGIAKENRNKVFGIFKRLHSRNKFGGGSGVGLTIVRKVIQRHAGDIWIESKLGYGTTFYFTLS